MVSMAKINNSMVAVLYLMSAGTFRGDTVNYGSCLCSPAQILASINNNLSRFFSWYAANGGQPIDPTISSWAQLAAIPTSGSNAAAGAGAIKIWVDSSAGYARLTQLLAGTDATDNASGIQRANDWATSGLIWYSKLA